MAPLPPHSEDTETDGEGEEAEREGEREEERRERERLYQLLLSECSDCTASQLLPSPLPLQHSQTPHLSAPLSPPLIGLSICVCCCWMGWRGAGSDVYYTGQVHCSSIWSDTATFSSHSLLSVFCCCCAHCTPLLSLSSPSPLPLSVSLCVASQGCTLCPTGVLRLSTALHFLPGPLLHSPLHTCSPFETSYRRNESGGSSTNRNSSRNSNSNHTTTTLPTTSITTTPHHTQHALRSSTAFRRSERRWRRRCVLRSRDRSNVVRLGLYWPIIQIETRLRS